RVAGLLEHPVAAELPPAEPDAGPFVGPADRAPVVVPGRPAVDHFAELAFLDSLDAVGVQLARPALEADLPDDVWVLLLGLDQGIGLVGLDAHGLFAVKVLAGREARQVNRTVQPARRGREH